MCRLDPEQPSSGLGEWHCTVGTKLMSDTFRLWAEECQRLVSINQLAGEEFFRCNCEHYEIADFGGVTFGPMNSFNFMY
jgi:hypothetical protein